MRMPRVSFEKKDRWKRDIGTCSEARKVSGWPRRCKLARTFLWKYSYKRQKLAKLLGQLSNFLLSNLATSCLAIQTTSFSLEPIGARPSAPSK